MLALSRAMGLPAASPQSLRVLGIDLGTTNSTVAELGIDSLDERPRLRCLPIEQWTKDGAIRSVLVPSVVAVTDRGIRIGEGARRLRRLPQLVRNRDIFYECKNEIGLRRTHPSAPKGLRTASEVAGVVLRFLVGSARSAGPEAKRVVVTVPASFQAGQRADTLEAAKLAGLDLGPGDLLDEPIAAFVDFVMRRRDEALRPGRASRLLVFDFGGGTCDVAIFRLDPHRDGSRLGVATLAVSRYHRLGGGDIDAVIVHEVLVPQLLEQCSLDAKDFDYDARTLYLEPALRDLAEELKIDLCADILRRRASHRKESGARASRSGTWPCPCPGFPQLALRSPELGVEAFAKVLQQFLDEDLLYPRETDYHTSCSIFAPIDDAVSRARLERRDVDLVLLVGGSSLVPQVQDALRGHFPLARLLVADDAEAVQTAVARGAACQALAIEVFGRGLVEPVSQDSISIRASTGDVVVVPSGASLPYPGSDGPRRHQGLVVPRTAVVGSVPLRVEFVAGDDGRPIYASVWDIPAPVSRGDALLLRVQLDANQCLHFELSLRDAEDGEVLTGRIENPLAVVVDPSGVRRRIEEAEEKLRGNAVPAAEKGEVFADLSNDYAELGLLDKSVAALQKAIHAGAPNAVYLNRLGIRHGERRDWKRQEAAYREANRLAPEFSAPLFNLAHSLMKRGELREAEKVAIQAFAAEPNPSYRVLHAYILRKLDREDEARRMVSAALPEYAGPAWLNDFDLYWYRYGSEMIGERVRIRQAEAEQARRRSEKVVERAPEGLLPEIAPGIRVG